MGLTNWIGRQLLRLPVVRDMARLAIEDFGHDPNIKRANTGDGARDVGYDPPQGRSYDAGASAEWPDPVYNLNYQGHQLTRCTPPAIIAFRKLGNRVTKLDWQARGGNPKRQQQMRYMVEHTPGWADMLRFLCWAEADGLRMVQIKTLDPKFNPSHWQLPDLRGGGRLKLRAGGQLHYDGTNLYVARSASGIELKEPQIIRERDQFIVHRPGSGSSPAGDSDLGLSLLNMCESWWDGFQADKIYKRRYNQEIYSSGRRKIGPANVSASFARAAAKIVELNEAGPEGVIVVSDEDEVSLRQLQPGGLADLWASMDKSAGIIYLLILASKITSDTSDAAGVGSSGVGLSEELAAALGVANSIAESINMDLVPWYASRNEELLEPLAEGEEEVYFVPEAPAVADTGAINGANKQKQNDAQDGKQNADTTGNAPGEDGRKGNPPATPATANLHALWENGSDSGATVSAVLDAAMRRDMTLAIEADPTVADVMIEQASGYSTGGILNRSKPLAAGLKGNPEPLHVSAEREINQRLIDARVAKSLGSMATGAMIRSDIVVAENDGYRVLRTHDAYQVQDATGKTLYNEDTLPMASLVFALLTEKSGVNKIKAVA